MIKGDIILRSLKLIIQNKTPFLNAVNSTSLLFSLNDKNKSELKKELISILKNYQKLSYEATYLFPTFSYISDEILLVIITIKYLRDKLDIKKVQSNFNSTISSCRLSPELKDKFNEIVNRTKLPFELENNVKNDPVLYNSIMLELPKFLFEKLLLEYSYKDILELSKKLQNNKQFYFLKNLYSKHDKVDLYSEKTDNFEIYKTNNFADAKNDLSKNNIYPITRLEINLLPKINNLNVLPSILISGKNTTSLANYFDMNFDKLNPKITRVVDSNNDNEKEQIELKHTSILPSSFDLLKTYLVNSSYDLVIYKGDDISIGKSSIYPNILPTLSEIDFKQSSNIQLEKLITISNFISKSGLLVFYNYSITKEENINIINSFLSKNNNFEVVESYKEFNDETDFVGYYCILKRKA